MAIDLDSYVRYPDISPYSFRFFDSTGKDEDGLLMYVNISSANNEILCSIPPLSFIPFMSGFGLINSANGSTLMANNKGLKQSPCLTPLLR